MSPIIEGATMQIAVEDAEDILEELVERAEAGEEIILTLDGRPAVRLVSTMEPEFADR
jgi:prevent-host-death family protein